MCFWFLIKSLLRNVKFALKRFLYAVLIFFEKAAPLFHKGKFTTVVRKYHYCITTHFIYLLIGGNGVKAIKKRVLGKRRGI